VNRAILQPRTTEALSNGYRRPVLEFRILGPLEVVGEQGDVRLSGPKQRATLAILLLSANRVVSVDRLADDLYAGAAPVTAVSQVQRQVSELRKALGSQSAIDTRAPGYVVRLTPDQLDLSRFERHAAEAAGARDRGDPELAAELLREALGLWRGRPLADLAYESFAQTAIRRLEEVRLTALEQRIEIELGLGRHGELVGELELLVADHPLREGLRADLMLALYRAGRQAEALEVYRTTRESLIGQFGIEPTPALQALERAILTHDPSLEPRGRAARAAREGEPDRTVLVLPRSEGQLDALLAIAEPLARLPGRELLVAHLVADERELGPAVAALNARRATLSARTRTAAFTTADPAHDAIRLAATYDVELMLLDAPPGLVAARVPDELAAILERSPADVGVLSTPTGGPGEGAGVFVPFGGGEHDWAALELGAWLALAMGASLRLVGTMADPRRAQRDASRLLADAALAVQRVVGIDTEPLLAEPTEHGLVAAVDEASLVVVGISPRWRREGIGAVRRALVRDTRPPTLLVHRGLRPGGLSPREGRSRFTWSLEPLPR
jgi:DNA-binding SARP family transcriptional activator